jgi:hypothetical protein
MGIEMGERDRAVCKSWRRRRSILKEAREGATSNEGPRSGVRLS